MIIAIDGPAGAGKSTIARLVAKELGYIYIDTGAIYRALTLKALNQGISLKDEPALIQMSRDTKLDISNDKQGLIRVLLDGEDVSGAIRSLKVTEFVSDVAKISGVRKEMLRLQRSLGRRSNAVMDGRDIGTVVFPDADRKFYLDANFQERAMRRYKELSEVDRQIKLEDVQADLANRDHIDSTRDCAPLKKADDAIYIDTTNMTIKEVVEAVLERIRD